MRLCTALRQSSVSLGRHRINAPTCNRRYSADGRARHGNPAQAHIEPKSSGGQLSSDRDDAFKIDPENKTVETAVGDLPLSPVMDPTFWEATRRHQGPKPKPGKAQNSVERQLRANPFAKALATPVRMCSVTRARLPSFFLQDFNVVAHPETNKPWLIPHSIIPEEHPTAEESDTGSIQEAISEADSQGNERSLEDVKSTTTSATENGKPHGPASYVLARQDLLSSFTTQGTDFYQGYKRVVGVTARYRNLAGKVIWRQDMDTYILDMMRQDIVNDILYLSKLCVEDSRYYIVKCYGWDDVQYKHRGAVLWFGEPDEDAGSDRDRNQPGPFSTFDIQTKDIHGDPLVTSITVHNIPMLLGAEQAKQVKKEAATLNDGSIFMLAGRRTTKLQLKLWRLQGYLADYIDI
ncbi:hypothetical protein M426DRAFT_322523 [Hypoxylon sp. CI-4A]|nr:hypothetical protein M426DRAFT_322523 [Hypoxylon sp. CI-4A]